MNYLSDYSSLASRAFTNQVHNSERFGSHWLSDLDRTLTANVSNLRSKGLREETVNRFVEGYRKRVSACFGAESRCASSFITGGSNFPVHQQQKRRDAARKHWDELQAYEARVITALERAARKVYKAENGITPLVEAQRNLNRRVQVQELMKKTNAALRKATTHDEQEAVLLDLGYSPARISQLLTAERGNRIGYQGWELSNNNAQIVRLKQRVEELKAKEYRAEQQDQPTRIEFTGGYVELNYTDDRLRIVHGEKPAAEVIATLKRNGFKWSPFNKAWQRQLTGAAKHAARTVLGIIIN